MDSPELSLQMLVFIGAALVAAGLGIGILLGRSMSPDGKRYRETERKLDQVLQDKKAYEDEVVAHFTDTAKLLNNLTASYREVHNQLSTGAATLCKDMGPIPMGRLDGTRDPSEIPADLADVHPPLDYAPKTSPHEKGMLNEEFGLDRRPNDPKAGKREQT